jgi:hypothetical protein
MVMLSNGGMGVSHRSPQQAVAQQAFDTQVGLGSKLT